MIRKILKLSDQCEIQNNLSHDSLNLKIYDFWYFKTANILVFMGSKNNTIEKNIIINTKW